MSVDVRRLLHQLAASCFGPVLTGAVAAEFTALLHNIVCPLSVWVASLVLAVHLPKSVSLVSCRQTFGICVQKAVASFQSSFAVGCVPDQFSHIILYWSLCVCDFLLVTNSNLGPILPRFRDHIAGSLLRRATPPLFHRNFGVFPSLGTFLWGDPLRIFRRLIPCQKLDS